jgi:phage tail sheath protein FI
MSALAPSRGQRISRTRIRQRPVKCDAETNPPELRDVGQIVTEIGVAIVRPAEFVIFRISQWAGPTQ